MSLVATRICPACVLFANAEKLIKYLFCAYKKYLKSIKLFGNKYI